MQYLIKAALENAEQINEINSQTQCVDSLDLKHSGPTVKVHLVQKNYFSTNASSRVQRFTSHPKEMMEHTMDVLLGELLDTNQSMV